MTIQVETTPYGPAAHTALAAAVARHKSDDPLAPVSVIVPTNQVGIAARRALGRRRGVAAVTFLTPYRLAELLGASALAADDRRPVSTPVVAGAVRAVLADEPGRFAGVHQHPSTERALVRAQRTLSEVDPSGLERLATRGSRRTADVVRVHRAVRERLRDRFSDEHDLVTAAVAAIPRQPPILRDLGPTIVFLPQHLGTNQRRLLHALGAQHPVTVLAGVTGVGEADEAVVRAVEGLGGAWPTATPPLDPAVPDRALSVSDADEEVRHAVRDVVDAARRGIPFGRIAILYGSRDPYARLLSDALDAAGIAWFGSAVRRTDSSLLGRSLLTLLALPDHDLARHEVAGWLAGAPVRDADNRPAPIAAWERAARAAGVVAGLDQWQGRLTRLADELDEDAQRSERDVEQEWRAERLRRESASARSLATFVTELDTALRPGPQGRTWAGLARWCRQLVRTYIGGETLRADWPPEEQAAARRVDAAIDRLGDLDGIDPDPSPVAFRRALALQLGDDLGRHGTFGSGVLVGPLPQALGLELDHVVIVGMAEGSCPSRRRDDPLIPDRERALAGVDLPRHADSVADEHRSLLAVVAAARHTTFTFPRGDLRRNSERAPSRWLLDAAEHHDGIRPSADRLGERTGSWLTEIPSFVAGLRSTGFPSSINEYDARTMLDRSDRGQELDLASIPEDRIEVRLGAALLAARLSSAYTRFDGNLAAADSRTVSLPLPGRADEVTSATRLESWATCPHAYFVRHVLGVVPVDDPEEQYRISPLTRGSLIHETLDRWLDEALQAGTVPVPGASWSAEQVDRLRQIGDEEARRLEQRGVVGRRVYWERDRAVIRRDLEDFVSFDNRQRAATGCTPIATELPFGMPGADTPPVEISLGDGRTITIRGAIDRIDRGHDGQLVVIDYKTGSQEGYAGVDAAEPTPGGTHLQLVLYALATRAVLDPPTERVRGTYWFVTDRGGFDTVGYQVTEAVADLGLETVRHIIDGIGAGTFPARPPAPKFRQWVECPYCEPDGLGLAHQRADWRRKRTDPTLASYLELCDADDE